MNEKINQKIIDGQDLYRLTRFNPPKEDWSIFEETLAGLSEGDKQYVTDSLEEANLRIEAAKQFPQYPNGSVYPQDLNFGKKRKAFIRGAKWMDEQLKEKFAKLLISTGLMNVVVAGKILKKLNSEQNVQASVATDDDSSNADDNQ